MGTLLNWSQKNVMTSIQMQSRAALESHNHISLQVWTFPVETPRILNASAGARGWLGHDALTVQSIPISDLRPKADRARVVDHVRWFDGTSAGSRTWNTVRKSKGCRTAHFNRGKAIFEGIELDGSGICDLTQTARIALRVEILSEDNLGPVRKSRSLTARLWGICNGLSEKMPALTPGENKIVTATCQHAPAEMLERAPFPDHRPSDLFLVDPAESEADVAGGRPADRCRG